MNKLILRFLLGVVSGYCAAYLNQFIPSNEWFSFAMLISSLLPLAFFIAWFCYGLVELLDNKNNIEFSSKDIQRLLLANHDLLPEDIQQSINAGAIVMPSALNCNLKEGYKFSHNI